IDCSYGYAARDNRAMQQAWANLSNKWPAGPTRVVLDCDRLAAEAGGRPATEADLSLVVDTINAGHADEEVFVPYTEGSLRERLARAPDLYGVGNIVVNGGAVA